METWSQSPWLYPTCGQTLHGPSSVNQGKQSKVAVAPGAAPGRHWDSRLQLTLSRLGGGCRRTAEHQSESSLAVPGRAGSRQGLREGGGGVALGTPAFKVAVGCGGTPDLSMIRGPTLSKFSYAAKPQASPPCRLTPELSWLQHN